MSTERRRSGARGEPRRDAEGRALCRWCGKPVKPPRRTFCDDTCVHEWRLRSNPAYVRQQVFSRDQGVCARCGTDAGALERELGALWDGIRRAERRARRGARATVVVEAYEVLEAWCAAHDLPHRAHGHFWEAHHLVPVVEGGGECGLDGYETLCLACHRSETAALASRRAGPRDAESGKGLGQPDPAGTNGRRQGRRRKSARASGTVVNRDAAG